jgi:hypothetical protein
MERLTANGSLFFLMCAAGGVMGWVLVALLITAILLNYFEVERHIISDINSRIWLLGHVLYLPFGIA